MRTKVTIKVQTTPKLDIFAFIKKAIYEGEKIFFVLRFIHRNSVFSLNCMQQFF
jgi:hypothetical protein